MVEWWHAGGGGGKKSPPRLGAGGGGSASTSGEEVVMWEAAPDAYVAVAQERARSDAEAVGAEGREERVQEEKESR